MSKSILCATALLLVSAGGARLPAAAAGDKGRLLDVQDELKEDDAHDKLLKKSFHKAHSFKMAAHQAYRIELNSTDFDTFLRLENEQGRQVAFNDDISQRDLNSRIIYEAPRDGVYRIIVTSYKPAITGKYTLTVVPASKQERLAARVERISDLGPEEQSEVLAEFRKHLDARARDIDERDATLALGVVLALDRLQSPAAAGLYREFAKRFAASHKEKVAGLAGMLEGAARRMELPGSRMDIKGTLLDGKKIDWASYKGKVVLVDFWATWCGPCRVELPNMKMLYKAYHRRGFDIVGISLDVKEESLTKFMENEKLPWACIYEKGMEVQPLVEFYGVFSIPQAILVDKEGRVISLNVRGAALERHLERLLGPLEEKKE